VKTSRKAAIPQSLRDNVTRQVMLVIRWAARGQQRARLKPAVKHHPFDRCISVSWSTLDNNTHLIPHPIVPRETGRGDTRDWCSLKIRKVRYSKNLRACFSPSIMPCSGIAKKISAFGGNAPSLLVRRCKRVDGRTAIISPTP
jgi:hypothetical protein